MSDKTGRPSDYTEDIANLILEEISSTTKGLATICEENEHLPSSRTIRRWIADREDFRHKYTHAKQEQAHIIADQIIEIADDGKNDTYETEEGGEKVNQDVINRSRLRVDARKWVASKLLPKIYGDKIQQEHSGELNVINWHETKTYDPHDKTDSGT